ncbi:SdpA family antimicrobial peptide system protein [Kitasatospora cineracea]
MAPPSTKPPLTSTQGFCFTAFLILVVLLASLTQLLPARAIPGWLRQGRSSVAAVWPQGWSFFADEPSANTEVAFAVGDGDQPIAVTRLQLDRRTAWGLSHSGYSGYVELGNLTDLVATSDWLDCTDLSPTACTAAVLRTALVHIPNRTAHPTLCGHVLITVQSPERWTADTQQWQSSWKIIRAVNGEVTCVN